MLQSRSKLHTRDDGKRDRERDGDKCSVLLGDDILQGGQRHQLWLRLLDDSWDHGTGPDLISTSSLVYRIFSFFSSRLMRQQLPVDVAASLQPTVAAGAHAVLYEF